MKTCKQIFFTAVLVFFGIAVVITACKGKKSGEPEYIVNETEQSFVRTVESNSGEPEYIVNETEQSFVRTVESNFEGTWVAISGKAEKNKSQLIFTGNNFTFNIGQPLYVAQKGTFSFTDTNCYLTFTHIWWLNEQDQWSENPSSSFMVYEMYDLHNNGTLEILFFDGDEDHGMVGIYSRLSTAGTDSYAKILNGDLSDFVGVWVCDNREDEFRRRRLGANGTFDSWGEAGNFRRIDNSPVASSAIYQWMVSKPDEGGFGVMLFPVGVDVMFRGEIFPTDTTKVRISMGHDFDPSGLYYRE